VEGKDAEMATSQMTMEGRFIEVQHVRVPTFIYGTAWKNTDTARLIELALHAGFRGIDTANQRRHYFEVGVGEALADAFGSGSLKREDLFLQTKFTYVDGQDHRLPYDENAPVATQVEQSFTSSLEHLGVSFLDSCLLHGPSARYGLGAEDWQTWKAMESLHRAGKTRLLGVSNVTIDQLEELYEKASIKPAVVQNRCFASQGWDRSVRSFCKEQGLVYQGFSLLTANPEVLKDHRVHAVASRAARTVPQVIFRFALQVGMVALTGTTSSEHMAEDLNSYEFELEDDELLMIEKLIR